MPDPFEDGSMDRPRYKFVLGQGNSDQENRLNQAAVKGYKATLMTFDPHGKPNNVPVIVLMERVP